jgi:hypothetical protein
LVLKKNVGDAIRFRESFFQAYGCLRILFMEPV